MTSIFTHFLAFNNDQRRLQQFRKQVEKLRQQKQSLKNASSFDENQFLQHCTNLRKQLDDYKRKAEEMKDTDERNVKENNTLKDLETITEQLSNLMTSDKTITANDSAKILPNKSISEEKNVTVEEVDNLKEKVIVAASLQDSSSDADSASDDRSIDEANANEGFKDSRSEIAENNQFIAVANFKAHEQNDLTLSENDLVHIIATREDGWWLAENANGDRGFVPKTFLRVYNELAETKECNKPLPVAPEKTNATRVRQAWSSRAVDETDENARDTEGQHEMNVTPGSGAVGGAIGGTSALSSHTTNIGQIIDTKILEESSSDISKISAQQLEFAQSTTLIRSIAQPLTASNRTFERDNNYGTHRTYECYLAPRLSKSNYAFHDIYWNYEDDRLRKRRVRVCKVIKVIRLDKVRLSAIDVHCRLVRAYLFDEKSTQEEYEIVSNVHTIKAYPRTRDPQTWIFSAPKDMPKTLLNYPSFIVRSNYKQRSVTLCLEAIIVFSDQDGEMREQSLGCVTLPIIDASGHCCMQNKNYSASLLTRNSLNRKDSIPVNTQIQIAFRVSDVSNEIIHQVDSLPDIFLCHTLFLPMFFYYRRLLGQFLTKDCNNCNSAALRAEPFLATFPAIADQPDIMEMLWQLWKIHETTHKKMSEMEEAERFRSFFLMTGFILHQTIPMTKFNWADARCFADRQATLSHFREQYLHNFDPIKYLSRQRCHPVNVYSCAIDVMGSHAII